MILTFAAHFVIKQKKHVTSGKTFDKHLLYILSFMLKYYH